MKKNTVVPIPSIDLLRGKPCRLFRGDPDQAEFYDADPVSRAVAFEKLGARRFHMVNLDGALGQEGSTSNRQIISRVIERLNIPVQVGGGIRSYDDVQKILAKLGGQWAIMGTSALEPDDETLAFLGLGRGSDQIIADIGFDLDEVKVRGWQQQTGLTVSEAMNIIHRNGFRTVVMTDKNRDGAQTGPNLDVIAREAVKHPNIEFIISGGIGNQQHLKAIKGLDIPNITGFIMGKRLWAEDGLEFFKLAIDMFA